MRALKPVFALSIAVTLALPVQPAHAGKKKIHETFPVTALPLPNFSTATGTARRSCFAGVEDVHWQAMEFTAQGKGELHLYMEGFTGDWDIALELDDGLVLYSVEGQIDAGAPPEENITVALKAGQTVVMMACNFAAPPQAEVHYEGTFK